MRVSHIALAAIIATGLLPNLGNAAGVLVQQTPDPRPLRSPAEPLPVATISGVAYANNSSSQRLNLYLPMGDGPFPLVIMIHGGAFMFGDPSDVGPGFKTEVDALNADGIAVASIGYRLSGEANFPAAVQDVKAAIRYLRQNAGAQKIDPTRFALWGKSAGANLALLGGLAMDATIFDDPQLVGASVDDSVKAIVAFYPPVDFLLLDTHARARGCQQGGGPMNGPHDAANSPESRYLGGALPQKSAEAMQANPITYLSEESPPLYVAAGTEDCTVAPDQSIMLFDALKARSPTSASASELHIVDGAKHADPIFSQAENLLRVRAFLNRHLNN